jgi:hypothetical protein
VLDSASLILLWESPSLPASVCKKVRKIILNTIPGLEETFKNGVPWYELKYYIAGFKDHFNVGFSVEGLNREEMGLFDGNGEYM